jgi:hypothetical protein
MKKAILCLLPLGLITFKSSGWGPTGQRVTGRISDQPANKKARKAINEILDGESLANGQHPDGSVPNPFPTI